MLSILLIINRLLPLVNHHNHFLSSPSIIVLISIYPQSSTDQWTAGIHFHKHLKKLNSLGTFRNIIYVLSLNFE